MVSPDQAQREGLRVRVVLMLMLGVMGILVIALWRLQVAEGDRYDDHQQTQSLRRIRIPATRGRMFDRNGVCLADNRPAYCIAVKMERLRQRGKWQNSVDRVMSLLKQMEGIVGRPAEIDQRAVWQHIRKRLPLPLIVWRDVDARTMARIAEHRHLLQGVEIVVEATRTYPQGRLAAHLLGYVGRTVYAANETDVEPYHYFLPEMDGRRGLELRFNNLLSGAAGSRMVRIDVTGYKRAELPERQPRAGMDLVLAIDSRIQRLAERSLGEEPGAVIVMDTINGDVLAMASAPAFDPNIFLPVLKPADWQQLVEDPAKPLLNRATGAIYPPGSVFKPIVALSALDDGYATEHTTVNCPGYFELGNVKFGCWNRDGHGSLAMRKAIEQSCNSYFCAIGLKCGLESIHRHASEAGYGRKTGLDCDYEVPGNLPDDAWKRKTMKDAWRKGDTCNLSIGQGALAATPIQVAVMTAAIASDGLVFKPRMVLGARAAGSDVVQPISIPAPQRTSWSPTSLRIVKGGMRDVVEAPDGTGKRARLGDIEMGGKTGTAEYGSREHRRKHTWMILFAPFDSPRYAAVMVLDNGESGGRSVAPRMHELMDGIFHGSWDTPVETGEGGAEG